MGSYTDNCAVIDCTKNWRQTQKKISLEDNKCVEDCKLTNYKYNSLVVLNILEINVLMLFEFLMMDLLISIFEYT